MKGTGPRTESLGVPHKSEMKDKDATLFQGRQHAALSRCCMGGRSE